MYMYKKLLGVTGAVLLSTSMSLCAAEDVTAAVTQSGQKTESEAGISPIELVKKSYAYLGSLKHYSFKATIVNEDDYADHMMLYLTHNYSVAVQRPDKVRMQVRGDVDNRDTIMNNGTVSIYEIEANKYAQIAIDGDIDDALDTLSEDYNFAVPLTQLLYSDTAEDLDFKKGFYFGTVTVDGKPCYYVGFPGEEWDIQLWIEKGDRPLIRSAAFVDKTTKGQPRSMIKVSWNLDEIKDQSIFEFTAPKDAKKIEVKKIEVKKIETAKTVEKDQK